MQVQSLGGEDPLEEEMATHSSILAWRIPRTEESGGQQSIGSHRVRHDWSDLAHNHTEQSWFSKVFLVFLLSFSFMLVVVLATAETLYSVHCGILHSLTYMEVLSMEMIHSLVSERNTVWFTALKLTVYDSHKQFWKGPLVIIADQVSEVQPGESESGSAGAVRTCDLPWSSFGTFRLES